MRIRVLGYMAMLLVVSACGNNDVSDLEQFIKEVKARPKGNIEPLPEIKVVESFIFKPEGLRDPFVPAEQKDASGNMDTTESVSGIRPDFTRRKEELEAYSLDTLRMVGTLSIKGDLWGLIRAGDKTIHRVQKNNYIGQNHGKIIRILEDKIELMEIVPAEKPGTWREQQASLALAG